MLLVTVVVYTNNSCNLIRTYIHTFGIYINLDFTSLHNPYTTLLNPAVTDEATTSDFTIGQQVPPSFDPLNMERHQVWRIA